MLLTVLRPKRYFSLSLSAPFSIPFAMIVSMNDSWNTYVPTTIWKKYVGIPSPKNSPMSLNVPLPVSPMFVMLPASALKINVIIDVIPMTIPAMTGVKNVICELMSDMMSANRSFSRSFTWCISFM